MREDGSISFWFAVKLFVIVFVVTTVLGFAIVEWVKPESKQEREQRISEEAATVQWQRREASARATKERITVTSLCSRVDTTCLVDGLKLSVTAPDYVKREICSIVDCK